MKDDERMSERLSVPFPFYKKNMFSKCKIIKNRWFVAFPIVVQHLVQLSQLRGIPQGLDHGANVAVLTFVTPLEMRVVLFEPQMEIIWESGSEWQLRYGLRYGLVWLGIGWKWTILDLA